MPYQLRFVIRGYTLWCNCPLGRKWDSQEEHNTYNTTSRQWSVSSDSRFFVQKPESPHTDDPNPRTPRYLNLDYDIHQRTKLDCLFIKSSKMLEGSEIQFFKNLCGQERTQIVIILMLSMENPRLAGYMLTGDCFMFLSTKGSLTWLYHCPLMRYPPHKTNQCYDKIPTF